MPLDIEQTMYELSKNVAGMMVAIQGIQSDIVDIKNDTRVAELKSEFNTKMAELKAELECEKDKVSKLVNYKYWLMGACAVASGVVSYFVNKL